MSDYVNVTVESEVEVQVECYCQECGAGVLDHVDEGSGNSCDVYASVCEACVEEEVERQTNGIRASIRKEVAEEIIEFLRGKYLA